MKNTYAEKSENLVKKLVISDGMMYDI